MIFAIFIALAFILQALTPRPAAACPAECEAWLCLPGGFLPSECNAAEAAVLRRLARGQDPLPPWSSCRARCNNAADATLAWTFPTELSCPNGGSLSVGLCRGIDANGCSFTYTPRNHGHVWVHVDGQKMDARYDASSLPYTLAAAGARNVDRATCPPPIDEDGGGSGDPHNCPPGYAVGVDGQCVQVIGPVVCNTISCPHVQHGWNTAALDIHWTLREEESGG